MNVRDSEKMAGVLEHEGYIRTDDPKHADLIVFNTCSIREKAEQKFFSKLGRIKTAKKRNPQVKIAVAGCIAQQDGKKLIQRSPYVDYILGPQNIFRLADIARGDMHSPYALEENPHLTADDLPSRRQDGIKAWVNIMYGCNNFCSYCVVPFTRGRERSRPSQDIIKEINALGSEGYREVTLLGQNVNSYLSDCSFPQLLHKINECRGIERIRFVTSHPKDLGDDLIFALRDISKVCEHIHLPLQSGSSRILELMNRKYTYEEYLVKVLKLRENIPGIAITSDIIVGFPQETDDDHRQTLDALESIGFDGLYAFKYSPRPHTHAENLDGHIDEETKSARLEEVLKIQNRSTDRLNKRLEGEVLEVLIENPEPGQTDPSVATGRTRTNKVVIVPCSEGMKPGDRVLVRIVRAKRHSLIGEIAKG